MELAEYPLLNTPNLTVVLLKTAQAGDATLDSAVRHLRNTLRRLEIGVPFDDPALRTRLGQIAAYLSEAGLLQRRSGDRIVITRRGRCAIAEHPAGFDSADLVSDTEMRRGLRRQRRRAAPSDPRTQQYTDGYNAYLGGARITDNPFMPDAVDHLAWEDGWCEARDNAVTQGARTRDGAPRSMPR